MTHARIFVLAWMLVALPGLVQPVLAAGANAQESGGAPEATDAAGTPAASEEGQVARWASWWDSQETWQRALYVLGAVVVLLVVLQLRFHWVEKLIAGIPKWWNDARIFLVEVKGEWLKVTKPPRAEVIQTTIVVVVTSFVFAIYLWLSDRAIMWLYGQANELMGL